MSLSGTQNDLKGVPMKRLLATALMLTAMLVGAAPALADTSSVGNLIAGTVAGGAAVAGSENLTDITGPPNLPIGSDTAFAGNPVPPNPVAAGINLTFERNFAVGGVGPARNDVVAESDFFGGDFTHTRIGNLSADTQ
jgi:hypothetical protein